MSTGAWVAVGIVGVVAVGGVVYVMHNQRVAAAAAAQRASSSGGSSNVDKITSVISAAIPLASQITSYLRDK